MRQPLTFRLKLALLAGVLRLLGRILGAARSSAKPAPAPANGAGRVIDGESRRVDEHYRTR